MIALLAISVISYFTTRKNGIKENVSIDVISKSSEADEIIKLKNLLDSGEFTVNEAAYTVGFNNMSFFYEVYRKFNKK